ncbi:MAG: hypothetical protein H0T46_00920 [Deltaproteobacteria bacterium]|nr:hypothetical protein [Deltaproteobacteria bacterium]
MLRHEGVGRYMEGALRLLQFVESRRATGRRFGPDADARWSSFRGDLETVDRIELMIRDADAEWPASFGARVVYALPGIPEDEPFGSQWEGLDPVAAEDLWRKVKAEAAPKTPAATLKAIAIAWGVKLGACDVGKVGANDRLVIAGASAIAAAIEAFASGSGLDWSDQVVVIATAPVARQLAAAATALLNAQQPAKILTAVEAAKAKPVRGARLVASEDADAADRSAGEAMAS